MTNTNHNINNLEVDKKSLEKDRYLGEISRMNKVYITVGILLVCMGAFLACFLSLRLINVNDIFNIEVKESVSRRELKIIVAADLGNSAYSVDKINTVIEGDKLIIKPYEKFVMFVPKEKLKSQIYLDVVIPSYVNRVMFCGGNEEIWKRK